MGQSPGAMVPFVYPAGAELRAGYLLRRRGVLLAEPLGRRERGEQGSWHDEVADAQRREDGAREGADVDDAPLGVEPLKRLERPPHVAELAVVVVLDDDGVLASRPREQRLTPREGENGARGELMRRRDEGDP